MNDYKYYVICKIFTRTHILLAMLNQAQIHRCITDFHPEKHKPTPPDDKPSFQ